MPGVSKERIRAIAQQFECDRLRLVDIARAVRAEYGFVSEEAIGLLAEVLGIPRIQVRDTVSFYHYLPLQPRGQVTVHLCHAVVERMKGADEVAAAFEEAAGVKFGQTSEDGVLSLEYVPCIGLSDQAPSALVGDVPVTALKPEDVPGIVAALRAGTAPAALPQAKVKSNICQRGEVLFGDYQRGAGLRRALHWKPEDVIEEIYHSGLRGCGGAGFPTGTKWRLCRAAQGPEHVVVCNADEGEPGTFKDRVLLTERAAMVLEGAAIAGYAIGAQRAFLYLRHEYDYLRESLEATMARMREDGLLGTDILGRGFNFDISIRMGAGAYICGEETALIESLEGKRGATRDRPPFPVQKGYLGLPTAVNNVETLACAARILEVGSGWFAGMGTEKSRGTKLVSVSGDCERPGVYEVEYGTSIQQILELSGAGDPQAVQVAGPAGQCLSHKHFYRRICFEEVPTGGSFIVFGKQRDILEQARRFLEFFAQESCGWCTPCRVGTVLMEGEMARVVSGRATRRDLQKLKDLADTVKLASRCGLGQSSANPVLSTMQRFPWLYDDLVRIDDGISGKFDLAAASRDYEQATGRKEADA